MLPISNLTRKQGCTRILRSRAYLEEFVLRRLPFVAVASSRWQYSGIQPLGRVTGLCTVPHVHPQFRVIQVLERVATQAGQAGVIEGVALGGVGCRCRAGERGRRGGRQKAARGRGSISRVRHFSSRARGTGHHLLPLKRSEIELSNSREGERARSESVGETRTL